MANKTFVSNGTFTVADNDAVAFGASVAGTEIVKILSGVTGVKLDANFEQIVLSGNLNTYKFLVVSGTGLQILATDGTTVIATIPNLNQVVKLVFADGFTTLEQTGSTAFKLGASSTVSTSTAGALTPTLSTGYTVSEFASAAGGIAVSETITVSDTASAISTDLALGASSVLLNNMAKIDAFTLSNSGSLAATYLSALDTATSVLVTAGSVTTLTGTAAEVKAVTDAIADTGNKIKVGTVATGATTSDVAITISDSGSVAATVLSGLDAKTSGLITAASVTGLTGTVAQIKAVTDVIGDVADKIKVGTVATGATTSNVAVTLTDVGSQSDTDSILGKTTGAVTTAALSAGTYNNLATGDKLVLKATAFGSGVSGTAPTLPAAANGVLDWIFNTSNNTLTYETADNGTTPTTVALILTGIASVSDTTGTITLTHA